MLRETTPSSMAASRFKIQNLTTALERILCGYGIVFSSRRPWFKSCPDLIFLLCIYSFVSFLRTLFVRLILQIILLLEAFECNGPRARIQQPVSRTFFFFPKIRKLECNTTYDWLKISMLLNIEKSEEYDNESSREYEPKSKL